MVCPRSLPAGDEPHGLLTDRTGETLFVANTAGDSISVIDLETGEVAWRDAYKASYEMPPAAGGHGQHGRDHERAREQVLRIACLSLVSTEHRGPPPNASSRPCTAIS